MAAEQISNTQVLEKDTNVSSASSARLDVPPAPAAKGLHEPCKLANAGPLGLCAFALTTFVLSAVNMHTRGVSAPNIAVPLAYAYGGLVQLLAGMWEMASGNTFGATAFSSYGGFWIAYGILQTPNWGILEAEGPYRGDTASPMALFLTSWVIFTTIMLLCTVKSNLITFILFFVVDITYTLLATEQYAHDNGNESLALSLQKAGGLFGFVAAFLAWYNALNGLQDSSNSFFQVPVFPFPWSDEGKALRRIKSVRAEV